MSGIKWLLPILLLVILLSACGDKYEGDFSYNVQDFSYADHNGEKLSKSDLEGKFWVADFIFTNCTTVCPPMTANMAKLQDQLKEAGLEDVQLVSFSVDPKHDTHKIMKKYVKSRGGSLDNWHLLTGYKFDEIKQFSIKSFKSAVEKVADSNQVIHATSFFVVTPEGNAIKRYDGRKAENMKKIVEDIKSMK
ncbi:SCO family protein [Virgibacillus siamensis]|uniref:SCO family protein n=1 Tax=Virgibacillus siamensis TaxID=480071 RepID=UPI00158D39F8|nr:SCO family protein [Virgibacillus siamensis]